MSHLDEIDEIQIVQTGAPIDSKRINIHLHDGVLIFKQLSKMSIKDEFQYNYFLQCQC